MCQGQFSGGDDSSGFNIKKTFHLCCIGVVAHLRDEFGVQLMRSFAKTVVTGIAVIPAQGSNERIPLKNIKAFCARPMVAWSIDVTRVTVSPRSAPQSVRLN